MTMKHVFHKGSNPNLATILLLHGTGGTETDLIPLADMVSPGSNILGVRGNVSEHGMPRFFRRLAEGVFDEEDLIFRTKELHEFVNEASETYDFDRSNVVAIGYSNGANIAGSLLFHYADSLKGAILHHPMVPLRDKELPDLSGVPVFIAAGKNDPMCAPQESEDLQQLLEGAGASVQLHWENNGHQLSRTEVVSAAAWFKQNVIS